MTLLTDHPIHAQARLLIRAGAANRAEIDLLFNDSSVAKLLRSDRMPLRHPIICVPRSRIKATEALDLAKRTIGLRGEMFLCERKMQDLVSVPEKPYILSGLTDNINRCSYSQMRGLTLLETAFLILQIPDTIVREHMGIHVENTIFVEKKRKFFIDFYRKGPILKVARESTEFLDENWRYFYGRQIGGE